VVQNKELPDDIPEIDIEEIRTAFEDLSPQQMENTPIYLPRLLVITGLAKSMSEANRLISQGAVNIDGKKILENSARIKIGSIIKAGKRRYIKIVKHRPSKREK
jgi:tyrosyl-tRNA synthetase